MAYDEMLLNQYLIYKQGLNDEEVQEICALHDKRLELFAKMEEMHPENDRRKLETCVEVLTQIEFDLQAAWKFDQDGRFHTWWYQAPHCICPKLDNHDCFGTDWCYLDMECPLHGKHTWISDQETSILGEIYQTLLIDPSFFKELGVNPWKAYSNLLNGKINRFKKIFARWSD